MQYKVKEGLTKEMFISTKWNQMEWTTEQKTMWQEAMFKLGFGWEKKTSSYLEMGCFFLGNDFTITYCNKYDRFFNECDEDEKHFSDVFDTIEDEETSTDDVLIINEEHLAKVGLSEDVDLTPKPVKSDGGSSSYYDIPISERLLDKLIKRRDEGNLYLKTEELIEATGSDFDAGNIFKCNVRILSLMNGCGKEGNSVQYDVNKIKYSADRLAERAK